MKWYGYWWGIVLLAESREDRRLLSILAIRLPKTANSSYDDGVLEYGHGPWIDEFGESEQCKAYLQFNR